jgi:hypothetical protein
MGALLAAYGGVLERQSGPQGLRRLVSWLLVDHVARTVGALLAASERRAAYTEDAGSQAELADRLARFRRSLPATPTRRLITTFVLAVFLCAFLLANFVFRSHEHARALGDTTLAIATVDRGALVDAAGEFDAAQVLGAFFCVHPRSL